MERARAATSDWTRTRPGLDVTSVDVVDGTVTVDVAGEQPPDVGDLVATLERELGPGTQIIVRFTERRRLFPPG